MGDTLAESPVLECPDTQRHALAVPCSSLDADSCYCKVLVTNHLAGIIIGQAGQEIRTLKNSTGAKIVLSPHGMYFPGTTERIAAVEGPEQAVFQVLDWILDKMADQRQLIDLPHEASSTQQPQLQLQQQDISSTLWAPRATCFRICVPRAVVGSLIGKNGGYIQSLRVATGAAINISPLFVTAEEACAERIVSVESRRRQSLKTAAFTLIRKINSHPERASCRHVCYFRKHTFESPLADPHPGSQAADFKLIRQQQLQQQQQEIDALRRRTVSLVMGTARSPLMELREDEHRNNSTSSSTNSLGENQFAAFKRFCEARAAGRRSTSNGSLSPETGAPAPSLCSKMQEVTELSRAAQAVSAAVTSSEKQTNANINNAIPWECTTVCSTAAGSIDRLPQITADSRATVRVKESTKPNLMLKPQLQQQHQLQQQQQNNPSIALLAVIAILLAALLRLLFHAS